MPTSVFGIFTSLCLSQVKEQLTENIHYYTPNPPSFICDGHLFVVAPAETFIKDEIEESYGLKIKYNLAWN
ncbi:MAG: hypothetical protein V4725_11565 [Bacteroidota bacterium]|nr:hypothetical protein [Ferruginibacter sp.]